MDTSSIAAIGRVDLANPTTVFLYQTSAPVFADLSQDAELVVRLHETDRLSIQVLPDANITRWWAAVTSTGQEGYIASTTKVATREFLQAQRERTRAEARAGVVKIFTGLGILILGLAATVFSVFLPVIYVLYGAIATGGGSVIWGIEQIFYGRHALRKFDELWGEAIGSLP